MAGREGPGGCAEGAPWGTAGTREPRPGTAGAPSRGHARASPVRVGLWASYNCVERTWWELGEVVTRPSVPGQGGSRSQVRRSLSISFKEFSSSLSFISESLKIDGTIFLGLLEESLLCLSFSGRGLFSFFPSIKHVLSLPQFRRVFFLFLMPQLRRKFSPRNSQPSSVSLSHLEG